MPKYDNEIQARAWSRADIGAQHLNQDTISYLNANYREQLENDLGIHFSKEGAVLNSGDVPRMFIIEKNRRDEEQLSSVNSSSIKPDSEEFWRQMQLGNVYAFPAGSKDPVQLQLEVDPNGYGAKLRYSKPVAAVPQPPAKPLGFWKRAAWLATFGNAFNKQRMEYKNRKASETNIGDRLGAYRRARLRLDDEKRTFEAWKKDEEVRKKTAELQKEVDEAQQSLDVYDRGLKSMAKVFGPQPEYDPNMDVVNHTPGTGLYTREQFGNLKQYSKEEFDLSQISVGGEAVSPEEFAAVTSYALWDPEIARKGVEVKDDLDQYAVQELKEGLGVPEEDIPEVISAQVRSFATTDMFIKDYRASGGVFFKEYTNAGRKAAVDAFREYSQGKPEKLAEIIATGVNLTANEAKSFLESRLTVNAKGTLAVSDKILGLLDRDPNLKALAEQKGMGKEQLQTVQNMQKLMQLDKASSAAEKKLGDGALGKKLTQKEKHDLAVDVIKSRIAISKLAAELGDYGKNAEFAEKYVTMCGKLQNAPADKLIDWEKAHNRGKPGPGKFWKNNEAYLTTGLTVKYKNNPESLKEIGTEKGMQHLDRLANKIVEQQKLDSMGEKELFALLRSGNNHGLRLSEAIPAAEEALKKPQKQQNDPQLQNQPQRQQNEPQRQNQAQSQVQNSFQSRVKMFEQQKQGGQEGLGKT